MARNIKKIFFNGEEYPPETFRLAMLLCMVGGFMDTYTFSTRGNVLANAQTGNIVFFAINLGKGNFEKALNFPMAANCHILSSHNNVFYCIRPKRKMEYANKHNYVIYRCNSIPRIQKN